MEAVKLNKTYQIRPKAAEITLIFKKILKDLNQAAELEADFLFDLELVLREMLANAIEHGCTLASTQNSNQEKMKVIITVKLSSSILELSVQDPGPGFNWLKQDLKKMPKFQARGRGLKIIYKLSNQLNFNQSGNKIKAKFYL